MQGTFKILLVLLFLGTSFQARGEIQKVTIKWNHGAGICGASCGTALTKEFSKNPAVASIDMNVPAGRIDLKWKPNAPFVFAPINAAMRMVGVSIQDLRVKVRGKIVHDSHSVTLVSEGDGTKFILLNTVIPNFNQQVELYNAGARPLTSENRLKLLEAEKNKEMAIVEGPILEPERSPPLTLILEQVHFEQ